MIISCLVLALAGTTGVVARAPEAVAAIPAPTDLFTSGMGGYDCIQHGGNGGSVTSSEAYNDGAWHHVAFQRQGTTLRLFVDGVLDGSATAPAGTVSPGRPFTMSFGRRLDGAQHFAGTLDEARLYRRALERTEIGRIHDTNAVDVPGAVLRLPFHPNFPTTPDVSANGNTSFVHGGAPLTAGRFGNALTFDGTTVGTAALSGSLTADQADGIEGINLGRKLITDTNFFSGSLDEVRVHLRALSDTELEALRTTDTTPANGLALHLPLDTKQAAQH